MQRISPLLIIFEGSDFTGKGSQVSLLEKRCISKGIFNVKVFDFPDYSGPIGELIGKYVKNQFDMETRGKMKLSIPFLFAADRVWGYRIIKGWLNAGFNVICDRGPYSNIAYQSSVLEIEGILPQKKAIHFIADLERKAIEISGIKYPDVVIYLRIPPDMLEDIFNSRSFEKVPKDIYEISLELQRKVIQAYDYVYKIARDGDDILGGNTKWIKVDATEPVPVVHFEIWESIFDLFEKHAEEVRNYKRKLKP